MRLSEDVGTLLVALALGLVALAFGLHLLVTEKLAGALLDVALHVIGLALALLLGCAGLVPVRAVAL